MPAPLVRDIIHEIVFQAQRSRGPGGQNVNRTNSSVQLRWSFMESLVLTDEQKQRMLHKMQRWMNKENCILIRSDVHRDQEQNKKETITRLQTILHEAFFQQKKRKPTKPTKSSQRKRVDSKRQRSEVKKGRQGQWD